MADYLDCPNCETSEHIRIQTVLERSPGYRQTLVVVYCGTCPRYEPVKVDDCYGHNSVVERCAEVWNAAVTRDIER